MKLGERWLLPDGVDEVLPPFAEPLEQLRRDILDVFSSWGYELVLPPLVEFLESLQSGNGQDLDLQTFKITDQLTGRLMGIRADITPQAARIDAHRLATNSLQRLCYVGPVLHARADKFAGSRNPLQIGAELFGHAGIESDAEVVCLLADVLSKANLERVTIELGHMGLFKALIEAAALDEDGTDKLLDALLRKAEVEVEECLTENDVSGAGAAHIVGLLHLNGGVGVVGEARRILAGAPPSVLSALDAIEALIAQLAIRIPEIALHVDLAELRGYRYHTGVIFAAYLPGEGRPIAWGGRYDNIGQQFGRPRAATGFSTDLKNLVGVRGDRPSKRTKIFAPEGNQNDLLTAISQLRNQGTVVIQELAGQVGSADDLGCSGALVRRDGEWIIEDLSD
ncbi:MAG: ATP phosphoribosyltransferase regulatory subunit [Gammaproteobacteria bacterium]|jgi:ATP phosphoribosyltransferase regulatory subunit